METPTVLEDKSQWLRSPLVDHLKRLRPARELTLRPYFGAKRDIKIYRTELTIGSSDACEIPVDDPFVSPRHAELRLVNGAYFVRDLASRNGVFLNGVRVDAAPLPDRGTLRIGRSSLSWNETEAQTEAEILEENYVVADPVMRSVMQSLRRVAGSSLPVLLLGETGTGKDVLARLLHLWSARGAGPFVPVNGALTGGSLAESELFGHRKGAFTGADVARLGALRSAHGGTLFLDEVADIPASSQVKLLRALEAGEVKALGADSAERAEFRLVCATSRDLERRVQQAEFRVDLYYRIAGFVVHIPPLRDRPHDVIAISRRLASDAGLEIDGDAESKLLSGRWPGNVRELRACVERAVVVARSKGVPRILAEHVEDVEFLPVDVGAGKGVRPLTLLEQERRYVHAALERNGWSRVAAARELGIARSSLHGKMKKYGLKDGPGVFSDA